MPLADDLLGAGFSKSEISDYLAAERQTLSAAGFSDDEIAAEFGAGVFAEAPVRVLGDLSRAVAAGTHAREAPPGNLRRHVQGIGAKAGLDETGARRLTEMAGQYAEDGADEDGEAPGAFVSGFQQSVTGLIVRGKPPDDPKHDLSTFERALFNLGFVAGDAPAMLAGGIAGFFAVPGPDPTDVVTVPAFALAVPAGMREALMQAYEKGEVVSWRDFFERSLAIAWETTKGAIIGAAVGKTGQVVPGLAKLPAQVGALVGVQSALEGRVPEPEEFLDAAILIGGLHGVGVAVNKSATKLRSIYAKTGRRPADVARDAEAEPEIATHVAEDRPGLPKAYEIEAARRRASEGHIVDEAIEGLRAAMDDPVKFEELQKARPEIRDLGQVQAMLEKLFEERRRIRAVEPPTVERRGGRLPPVFKVPKDKTFVQWIRSEGGIKSTDATVPRVRAILDKEASTVIHKNGLDLDELGERAFEAGWFDERPGINEILDLLDEGRAGPVFRKQSSARETLDFQAELDREANRYGIEPRGLTDDAFFTALENARREHLRDMDEIAKGEYYEQQHGPLDADVGRLGEDYGKAVTLEEFNKLDAEIKAAEGTSRADRPAAQGRETTGEPTAAVDAAAERADGRLGAGEGARGGVGFTPAAGEAARGKVGLEPGLTEPRLTPGVNEAVISAAEELLLAGEVVKDNSRLISDQITELLQTERIEPGHYAEILERHGITANEFAQLWRADTRKAAQHLAELSKVEAKVKKMLGEASEADLEVLREAGLDRDAQAKGLWRRLDNVRRGILVTQLATAVRNFEVQVGRIGIDVLQKGLDAAIQRALPEAKRTVHPADAFEVVLRMFRPINTKGEAETILSRFPKEADDLFLRYSSDLTKAGKGTDAMAKAEKSVWFLNIMNRFQEYAVRRPVFVAELERMMALKGQSLEKIIAENRIGEIARDDIKAAVTQALEMTFAKDFNPAAKGAEGIAGSFIRMVNKLPGLATIPFPFPRFLMNAIKFQYEFSPAGFLKLVSKKERAKIAAGDTSAISRAAIGTAMLFAAWEIRNSDWAGEKWWEIRMPSGETVSLLPFNPFVFHLFVADVAKRANDGTLSSLTSKDLAFGFLSSNFRAGAGLFVLDSMIEGLLGLGNEEKALVRLQELAAEIGSGFLVPLQMLRDLYTEYDTWLGSGSEAIIRDKRDRPFAGPFIDKIPGLSQTLPEAESPTRAAPMRRRLPAVRQLTGLGFREAKNPAEQWLDKLGFTRQEIAPSTGNAEANRLIAKHLGPLVEAAIVPLVQTPFFLSQSNEVKAGLLREALLGLRALAVERARSEDKVLFAKIRIQRMPRRRRRMLEDLLGFELGEIFE